MADKVKTENVEVLRFFGADTEKIRLAAEGLASVSVRCAGRGGETLLALSSDEPRALPAAEKRLKALFKNELYGRDGQTLAEALAAQLEKHGKLLACADADTGALLEPRLENIEGAAKVFDFGALSYAHPETRAKIKRGANGRDAAHTELARVRATLRVVGTELAAGSVRQGDTRLLFAGTRKACWVRAVAEDENPALWLMDMLRRLACGLKQAEGTRRVRYSAKAKLPQTECGAAAEEPNNENAPRPAKSKPKGHALRRVLILLFVLALAALAGAWYFTGGDLSTLPELLGFEHQLHSGAQLV